MKNAAGAQTLIYPSAHRSDQEDVYFGHVVADPYRWMEDLDSLEIKTWVDAQNSITQSFLADVPARDRIHARLMDLSNYERFGMPQREGGRYFYLHNSGLQNQSVLYWQEGKDGTAQVLLDPNTLALDATISLSSYSVSDDGKLMVYALSEAGSDIQKVRVKVVQDGHDLPDLIEWVKFSGLCWSGDLSGFYYSGFGVPHTAAARDAALKSVNLNHKVYFHRLGTPQNDDTIVFERPDNPEMLVHGGISHDQRWLILSSGRGHTNALAVRDLAHPQAPDVQLAPLDDAIYAWIGNVDNRAYLQVNKDAPNGKIVEVDLERPDRANWKTVVPESQRPIDDVTLVGGTLVISSLEDASTRIEQRTLDGTLMREVALPGIGMARLGGGKPTDTDLFFVFTNYTTPGTVHCLELSHGATSVWKQPKLVFDPNQYKTLQIFAPSKDGTQIPLFVTFRKDVKLDGTAPAILYGYGGFSVSLGPAFSSSRLAWMEMGGIYAEAILRGGGEYGEQWHQAGTRLNKQNVFDDFIGCAEFLIAERYTSAHRLAINGGSNGGLLVAASELQRPELFGAVLAQVGVLDMLRFDKFTIGYAWKPDYGSPSDDEAEFRAIFKYSPLHNVQPGVRYPPTLILTADHDDRVFPAHSFKFAATMQAEASQTSEAAPVLIRVETRGGHGAGLPLSKQLDATADMYAFLVKELKMDV